MMSVACTVARNAGSCSLRSEKIAGCGEAVARGAGSYSPLFPAHCDSSGPHAAGARITGDRAVTTRDHATKNAIRTPGDATVTAPDYVGPRAAGARITGDRAVTTRDHATKNAIRTPGDATVTAPDYVGPRAVGARITGDRAVTTRDHATKNAIRTPGDLTFEPGGSSTMSACRKAITGSSRHG